VTARDPRVLPEPLPPRICTSPIEKNGNTPNSNAAITEMVKLKARTPHIKKRVRHRRKRRRLNLCGHRRHAAATRSPAKADAPQSSRHSVSNCRLSLERLAPKAERIFNSEVRSAIPAISRFATLVQAINKNQPPFPPSTSAKRSRPVPTELPEGTSSSDGS
jgi:hypothetical protein